MTDTNELLFKIEKSRFISDVRTEMIKINSNNRKKILDNGYNIDYKANVELVRQQNRMRKFKEIKKYIDNFSYDYNLSLQDNINRLKYVKV